MADKVEKSIKSVYIGSFTINANGWSATAYKIEEFVVLGAYTSYNLVLTPFILKSGGQYVWAFTATFPDSREKYSGTIPDLTIVYMNRQ